MKCFKVISFLFLMFFADQTFAQSFEERKLTAGNLDSITSYSSLWFDMDQDYDLDLLNLSILNKPNKILINHKGQYKDGSSIIENDGGNANGACLADIDFDGDLDLFVYSIFGQRNLLYIQDAKGVYVKDYSKAISNFDNNAFYASFSDYDLDNDPDLIITNTELWNPKSIKKSTSVFVNDGKGNFTKNDKIKLDVPLSNTRSFILSDLDNDGREDLLLINFGSANELYLNKGADDFRKTPSNLSLDKEDALDGFAMDFDNDGDADIIISTVKNGIIIFRNDGNLLFTKISDPSLSITNIKGLEQSDLNNDGKVDIVVHQQSSSQKKYLFNTDLNKNHWIRLKLRSGRSNFYAVGAKVSVHTQSKGRSYWQYKELKGNSNALQANVYDLHFGLGEDDYVDTVKIIWPDGTSQILNDLVPDRIYFIEQGSKAMTLDAKLLNNSSEPRIKDLTVYMVADTFRMGEVSGISIFYENKGIVVQDIIVKLNTDNDLRLVNSFPYPEKNISGKIEWRVKSLAPGARGIITMSVQCLLKAELLLQDKKLEVSIEPFAGDEDSSNNRFELIKPVR